VIELVYKMKSVEPTISVNQHQDRGDQVAEYLESTVKRWASRGWEFYRLDAFETYLPPGCIGSLLGQPGSSVSHYVATFRRRKSRQERERDRVQSQPKATS
jgi:hypothetical protein